MHGVKTNRPSIGRSAEDVFGVPMTAPIHTDALANNDSDLFRQRPVACNELNESALATEIARLTRLMPGEPTLSEEQVAAILKRAPKTLQNQRLASPELVPAFVQLPGSRGVIYMRDDVIRYMAIQILNTKGRWVHRL